MIIIIRADIFEIRPMLDLFVQKIVPFASIDQFSVSALMVAKYAIGINASRYLPQLQSWAFSYEPKTFARSEQQFDQEIETISLFVGIALLTKQPSAAAIGSSD